MRRSALARRAAAFCVCESKRRAARIFRCGEVLVLVLVLVDDGAGAGDGDGYCHELREALALINLVGPIS